MWNNNDEDYDHVDAGNQERAELGKKLCIQYRRHWVSLLPANSHFFICFKH